MRRLLLIALLTFCTPAFSAVTLVQAVAGAYAGASTGLAANFTNNTAGNIGVVASHVCVTAGTAALSSVTDTSGNSYTVSAASLADEAATHYSHCYTQFAYTTSLLTFTGTNTVTANYSTSINGSIGILELTAGQLDQTITGVNANTSLPTPGSITTASNGSFYVAAGILDDGFGFANGWFTAGGSFTLNTENGGGNLNSADEYQAQTSAGAITGTFGTNFGGVTGPNAGSMITFKPGSSGPPRNQFPRIIGLMLPGRVF